MRIPQIAGQQRHNIRIGTLCFGFLCGKVKGKKLGQPPRAPGPCIFNVYASHECDEFLQRLHEHNFKNVMLVLLVAPGNCSP